MVVDTSVWIDLLNGHATARAGLLARALDEGDLILLPGLVLTEILQGLPSQAHADQVAELMSCLPMPPELDEQDYVDAAALYRACRAHGATPRSTIDCLIAQTCLRLDLPILAQDRDYEMIARIAPLRLAAAPAG